MSGNLNKTQARHEKILSLVNANDLVSLGEFCEILKCSESTIRNDLKYLEENGMLRRTFGGAVATGDTPYNVNVSQRAKAYKQEKKDIAGYIVNTILSSGMTITLDSGTTNVEIAQRIIQSALELTVITNSLPAAAVLSKTSGVKLFLAGGEYNNQQGSFTDQTTNDFLMTMRSDMFFLAVNGVSEDAGFTIAGPQETQSKQTMIRCSKQVYAVSDHSKIGKTGLKIVCGFDLVNTLITDDRADIEEIKKLEEAGLKVMLAPQGN